LDLIKRLLHERFIQHLMSRPRAEEKILFFGMDLHYQKYIGYELIGGINVLIDGPTSEFLFLTSLMLQDIICGRGFLLITYNGRPIRVDKLILSSIPKKRIDDVVYVDPLGRKSVDIFKLNLGKLAEEGRIIIVLSSLTMNTDLILEKFCSEMARIANIEPFRIYACRIPNPSIDTIMKVKKSGLPLVLIPGPIFHSDEIKRLMRAFDLIVLTKSLVIDTDILAEITGSLFNAEKIRNSVAKGRVVVFSPVKHGFLELRPIFLVPEVLTPPIPDDEFLEEIGIYDRGRIDEVIAHSLNRWGAARSYLDFYPLFGEDVLKATREYSVLKEYINQGYGVTIKTIGGRNYLYVQKKVKGKVITRSLGPLSQDMIEILNAFPEVVERLKGKLSAFAN